MLPAVSAALAEWSPEGHWAASERSMQTALGAVDANTASERSKQSTLRPRSLHVMNRFATRFVDALA